MNNNSRMDLDLDLEDEVRETIRVGNLIGFHMDGHQDSLRNMISSQRASFHNNKTVPSTSKSNRQEGKNSKFVPKLKQLESGINFTNAGNTKDADEVLETIKLGKLIGIDYNTQGHEDDVRKMTSGKVTKPSISKSTRRKGKKFKFVPKPKQRWQVKQPTRNWLDLPSDVMANILSRIGVFDILENAQKVCTTWRQICKDPAMWRVVSMDNFSDPSGRPVCQEICKHVVDRSQGQMVDISIIDFCDDDLLRYIADRSSQLRRLEIIYCFGEMYGVWGESLKKLSLLEELSLCTTEISDEDIEAAGHYCPLLKTLKVNQKAYTFYNDDDNDEESMTARNALAVAIGKNLPELRHLELIGETMTNIGLKAILDGCRHLESLDLRRCLYIDLKGDLGKRCSEQIKHLKFPHDSLEGCQHLNENVDEPCDVTSDYELYLDDSDDDFYGDFDYDYSDEDYDEIDDFANFVMLNEAMAFMAMRE